MGRLKNLINTPTFRFGIFVIMDSYRKENVLKVVGWRGRENKTKYLVSSRQIKLIQGFQPKIILYNPPANMSKNL